MIKKLKVKRIIEETIKFQKADRITSAKRVKQSVHGKR